jgi:glycosyltransferase involved in cell wall biosynthesis
MLPPVLFYFHCRMNTGYAIESLERVFLDVGRELTGSEDGVHFAYPDAGGAPPPTFLPPSLHSHVVRFDPAARNPDPSGVLAQHLSRHGVRIAIGFDQRVRQPGNSTLRQSGIELLISYWGAPMSDINRGLRLALKRLEVRLAPYRPDHFVFESVAMQESGVRGRGLRLEDTSVCYLGVDTDRFRPDPADPGYAHAAFGIPRDRRIVFFSGHMEERKGIRVILRAASRLVGALGRRDVHFLLLGNRPDEEAPYRAMLDPAGNGHVTFGGYRTDIDRIVPCASLGVIASTGWDSFTMSSLEIAASGVPLIASRLQGLAEAVDHGRTGLLFTPGSDRELAEGIVAILDTPDLHSRMSAASRSRILGGFTRSHQVSRLAGIVRDAWTARRGAGESPDLVRHG